MQELLEFLVSNLVSHPDRVQVTATQTDDTVALAITVDPDDMGKVIGRNGRVIKALRTVIGAVAAHQGLSANVDVA